MTTSDKVEHNEIRLLDLLEPTQVWPSLINLLKNHCASEHTQFSSLKRFRLFRRTNLDKYSHPHLLFFFFFYQTLFVKYHKTLNQINTLTNIFIVINGYMIFACLNKWTHHVMTFSLQSFIFIRNILHRTLSCWWVFLSLATLFPLSSLICSAYAAEVAAKWTWPPTLQKPHLQLPTHRNHKTDLGSVWDWRRWRYHVQGGLKSLSPWSWEWFLSSLILIQKQQQKTKKQKNKCVDFRLFLLTKAYIHTFTTTVLYNISDDYDNFPISLHLLSIFIFKMYLLYGYISSFS